MSQFLFHLDKTQTDLSVSFTHLEWILGQKSFMKEWIYKHSIVDVQYGVHFNEFVVGNEVNMEVK